MVGSRSSGSPWEEQRWIGGKSSLLVTLPWLKRLGTDYIDLYQTHWPDHGMPYEEVLGVLTELRDAGKVRVVGCSNETSWGLMKSLWTAETHRC